MFSFRNRYEEMESYRRKTNFIRFLEGLLIGNLIGIIVGLLLAPKSGKETAADISNEAQKWIQKGKGAIPNMPDISKLKFAKKSDESNEDIELSDEHFEKINDLA